jgi:hypothetical protein
MSEIPARPPDKDIVAALASKTNRSELPVNRVGFVPLGQRRASSLGFRPLPRSSGTVPPPDFSEQDKLINDILAGVPVPVLDDRRRARIDASKAAGVPQTRVYEETLIANARSSFGPSERQGPAYARYLERTRGHAEDTEERP